MQLLNSQKGVSHGELCIVSEEPTTAVVQCFSVLKPGGLFFFKDYGPSHGTALTWHRRMKITLDIARGLEYLHERCNPPVIHIDLKSANIFLDSNFNAKISDFGLATTELLAKNKVKLSGTSAYVAPEYLSDGKLTDKSDVYAFGVILLELLIDRRPVEKMSPSLFHSFVTWGVVAFWNRQSVRSFYIMHPHEVFKCAFKS